MEEWKNGRMEVQYFSFKYTYILPYFHTNWVPFSQVIRYQNLRDLYEAGKCS